jgi:hypothetical protein
MMPDWSDWPDVYANQATDVSSPDPKYNPAWNLHDNSWEPVHINWAHQGTEYDVASTFDNGWAMDIMDSNYLWSPQGTPERGVWDATGEEETGWTEIPTGGGMWKGTDKEDTDWSEKTKGTTEWQKKDYWQ